MFSKSIVVGLTAAILSLSSVTVAFAEGDDKGDLAYAVHNFTGNWWESICVDKLMTFKLPPAGWAKIKEQGGRGIDTTTRCARYMNEFAHRMGLQDVDRVETAGGPGERDAMKPRVQAAVDEMKNKVTYTLEAPMTMKFDKLEWDLTNRYMLTIISEFKDSRFKPKGDAAFITQIMSTTAKDISVNCDPDGKHFTITCPAEIEPSAWDDKIIKGMLRYSK